MGLELDHGDKLMATNKIGLNVSEIKKINEIIDKFQELSKNDSYIEISVETNGLGKITAIEFPLTITDTGGKFVIEITGSDKW